MDPGCGSLMVFRHPISSQGSSYTLQSTAVNCLHKSHNRHLFLAHEEGVIGCFRQFTATWLLDLGIVIMFIGPCYSWPRIFVWQRYIQTKLCVQLLFKRHSVCAFGLQPVNSSGQTLVLRWVSAVFQLIEAGWWTYALVNWVIISWQCDLLHIPCQLITWKNGDLLSMWTLKTNFSEIITKNQNL